MRANAEAGTLGVDGGGIGGRQIFLAEMNIVGPELEGLAPVVVDDQLTVMAGADILGLPNFFGGGGFFFVLLVRLACFCGPQHPPGAPTALPDKTSEYM